MFEYFNIMFISRVIQLNESSHYIILENVISICFIWCLSEVLFFLFNKQITHLVELKERVAWVVVYLLNQILVWDFICISVRRGYNGHVNTVGQIGPIQLLLYPPIS